MKTTNYYTLDNLTQPKPKPKRQTKFNLLLDSGYETKTSEGTPDMWDNCLYIGNDLFYGDVFKCWNNRHEFNFTIFFGEKGDEFDEIS